MSEQLTAAEWTGSRGEKWLSLLTEMEAMLAPVSPPLVKALRFSGPAQVVDIGCGGGGAAFEICRRAPDGSRVDGVDISEPLIAEATRRAASGPCPMEFRVANAEADAPARLYDRLASRFGVMFFQDEVAAFGNLFGWLRPGGRIAFAVWSRLEENAWMRVVREAVAEVVELPQRQPDAPGPFRYGDPATLLRVLHQAGFRELESANWQGMLPMGGGLPAEKAADFALNAFSTVSERLAEAGAEATERVREILARRLGNWEKAGAVQMEASVHLITGARPA